MNTEVKPAAMLCLGLTTLMSCHSKPDQKQNNTQPNL